MLPLYCNFVNAVKLFRFYKKIEGFFLAKANINLVEVWIFFPSHKEGVNLRAVSVEDLKPGMILARTIVNSSMVVVLSEDTLLTKAHITRLTFLNIPVVYVKDDYELNQNYQSVSAIFNRGNAFVKEYSGVIQTARNIFAETSKSGKIPVDKTEKWFLTP